MTLKVINNALVLFISFLSLGCGASETKIKQNEDITTPLLSEDGTFCFIAEENATIKHLQLTIQGKSIEGIILVRDQVWGDVVYSYSGEKINDTLYKIVSHEYPEDLHQEWTLHIEKNILKISGISTDQKQLAFTQIECKDFPESSDYITLENILSELEGSAYESAPTVCFYKYYPTGSNRRVTVAEYLRIKQLDGSIDGIGAGYSEGDPDWQVEFSGELASDSNYHISATYTTTDHKIHKTSEVWAINFEKGSLRVLKIATNDWRQVGAPFHEIDCDGIDEWALKLMYPKTE